MAAMTKEDLLDGVARMFDRDSETAITLRHATGDSCQTAAVHDNVTDLEERRSLFHDFLGECSRGFRMPTVICLSVFLLSPIDQLRHQVADAKASWRDFITIYFSSNEVASDVVRSFLAKGKTPGTPGSSAPGTPKAAAATATATAAGSVVAEAGKESAPVMPPR
ncbi:hypothetical protein GGS23DRAFT_579184 [Durotheca rogersii]|uniref:uncharacterized protein n=1 Tax=Durotheca rogersii TaxID=419775 RepID=UPI00221F51E7|nr:uncharacterized protein GGS23DRAFT_579184 [Durotheca rogersii]KAI5860845.1 hypothetical protein GGS23DRAFT_579184 [Durotheca rogersii]